ncbi:MAG TPA: glycosyltransferase [Candidatus Babeliales bacterium]|nr:glycosyltransferase [Candidatus Babeliales bacterium]
MKRLFATIIAIIFVAGILFFYLMPPQKEVIETESPYNIDTYNRDKKKILIFSSKGGGGHTSVTNALYQYLEHDYCLGTSYIIPHILKSIDVFQKFSNEKVTFEDMHNWLAKKKWFSLLNLEYNLGLWFFALNRKNIEKSIEEYLLAYPPDLIISVVTVANGMVLSVAKKLNIPFLLIPTDLDAFAFLNQLDNPKYDKFHIALSYDKKSIRKQFEQKKIKSDYITYTGFPVKKEFLEPSIPKKYIREAFAIPNNKPVILLMMGSLGSDELLHFSKELSKLSISAHIIIALGKNEQIKAHIEKIKFPEHITKTVLGFTDKMPAIMAISDLFITKPGSVSINEAIYTEVPILLDNTTKTIAWEKFNSGFILDTGIGEVITKYNQIIPLVTNLLTDKEKRSQIKKNFQKLTHKNPEQEIRLLVKQILNK